MKKTPILLVSLLYLMLTSSGVEGCQAEETEASEKELEAARLLEEAAEWETLIEAISGLETGTLDERILLADEIYWREYLAALDNPPYGDRAQIEQVVERLRAYVATEPKAWLVYRVTSDLWDVDADEVAPLLFDLTLHPAPSIRAEAIDSLYNYLSPEEWSSTEDVGRQLTRLWNHETHTSAKIALVDAMAYYEVKLRYQDLALLLSDDDDELVEGTLHYLVETRPERWIDLLLEVAQGDSERSRQAIEALTISHDRSLDGAEAKHIRIFFESRLESERYAWARNAILDLLARYGSNLAEIKIRNMFRSTDATTALAGFDLLKRMQVADWSQCVAGRVLEGDVVVREKALYEISTLPWIPAFDDAVTRIAMESESRDLLFAARIALRNPENPASDRSHLVSLSRQLELKYESLPAEGLPSGVDVESPHGFGQDVTHIVVAPPGQRTVRCFRAPDCEAPADKARRLQTGHPISSERFIDVDAIWLEVEPYAEESCWVSENHAVPKDEYQPVDAVAGVREEVEIARATLRSPEFIHLNKFKVLETFDIGTRLAGCRLIVDVRDAERIERLRKATNLSQTNLADGVRQLLPEIESTYGTLDGWEAWAHPSDGPD